VSRGVSGESSSRETHAAVAVLWIAVLGGCLLVDALIFFLAIISIRDPEPSLFTMASMWGWTTVGPHLAFLSFLEVALATASVRRVRRRMAAATVVVATLALVVSVAITGRIVLAAGAAGGSVNPILGLVLGSFTTPEPDSREVYTTVAGQPQEVLIYRPTSDTTPAPVFVYIHGGGWNSGTADDSAHDLRWFADRGWLVISVEYPLATTTYPTWEVAPQTVSCALVWTAQNAARFGGDAERLVVAGDSAGGNLALNLAYSAASGHARSNCAGEVPTPNAVVVQYPVVDPQDAYDRGWGPPGEPADPKVFLAQYIGGTPQQFPDRIKAISTQTFLSDMAPQTLVIEPEKDGLIPTHAVINFVAKARAAGIELTLVEVPFADHGYDRMAANSIGNQARLTITQRYLDSRGF
jgi:acetyl esterase